MTTAPATHPDRDALLKAVRAAGVLTAAQEAKTLLLTQPGSGTDAADALVAAGLLTRFQADRLLAGRIDGFLLGPYLVLDQIGRGPLSRVYRARHRTLNRVVAVKVLSGEQTRTADARVAFRREARAAGKLAHPNIVTAYDADEWNGRLYFVQECIDGPSLDAVVRARGPLPLGEAFEYIRQAALGLRHAHEQGMSHRNVKPQNLLVARPSPSAPLTVKVADFGIGKLSPAGPGVFAAPELRGAPHAVDARADLYGLGAVFHYLLTGRAPGTRREPLAAARPDVPPDVAALLHRLLAPAPAERFASANELLAALDAACVPMAVPMPDATAWVESVNFEMPQHPGPDSGFLSGRNAVLDDGSSPWEQLTDPADGNTLPLSLEETPPPLPFTPVRRGEPVSAWTTAVLLSGIVALSLVGIGVTIKLLVK